LGKAIAGRDAETFFVRVAEGDQAGLSGEHLSGCFEDDLQKIVEIELSRKGAADLQEVISLSNAVVG
jgi:hypothetical protein